MTALAVFSLYLRRAQAYMRRFAGPWLGLVMVGVLAAVQLGCGVGTEGTGTTVSSVGSINGYGSIIVNGVRYDESAAAISDDDGEIQTNAGLKLGMTVQVQAVLSSDGTQGTASQVRVLRGLRGVVTQVDTSKQRLLLAGQWVQTDDVTIWDGPTSLAAVTVGMALEVYGWPPSDAAADWRATRVESVSSTNTAARVTGTVTSIDSAQGIAVVNGRPVKLGADLLTSKVTVGSQLVLSGSMDDEDDLVASAVQVLAPSVTQEGERREVAGQVQSLAANRFVLGTTTVDVSSSTLQVENGTLKNLANGVTVEVKGTVRAGVLYATQLEFDQAKQDRITLIGKVTDYKSLADFKVREVAVDASTVSGLSLQSGDSVTVKGYFQPGRAGRLVASEVRKN